MDDESIDFLLQTIEDVIQSGETIPDELIAELSDILFQYVEDLEQRKIVVGPTENLPQAPHESSNVNGFRYNPKSGKLEVQFHGPYPKAAGSIYEYEGVPPYIFDIFARGAVGPKTSGQNKYHKWTKGVTPSHGAALNALVKAGKFPYKKVA